MENLFGVAKICRNLGFNKIKIFWEGTKNLKKSPTRIGHSNIKQKLGDFFSNFVVISEYSYELYFLNKTLYLK